MDDTQNKDKDKDGQKDKLVNETLVYCDVETNNLSGNVLLQVSANSKDRVFDIYCTPTQFLGSDCERITGLYALNGNLYKRGRKLYTFPVRTALEKFKDFIESFETDVIIVCFNCFGFDAKVLIKHFDKVGLSLPSNLTKFADPLPSFRKILKGDHIENFRLSTLCDYYSIDSLKEIHNAKFDSQALEDLCNKVSEIKDISLEALFKNYTKPIDYFQSQLKK